MKKTGDIAVITNVSVEPFLSRELSALSDVIDIPVEAVSVPFMEYREHDDIYSKTGMVFVWLNLESMVPDWEDRDAALLRNVHPISSGHIRNCAAISPGSPS